MTERDRMLESELDEELVYGEEGEEPEEEEDGLPQDSTWENVMNTRFAGICYNLVMTFWKGVP